MGLRVVVADVHALVREGIAGLIAAADDLEVAGTAGDLRGLLQLVDDVVPDVVVTDIRMPLRVPTRASRRLASALRERHPDVGVVVLSLYAMPAYARALLGDGTAPLAEAEVNGPLRADAASVGLDLGEAALTPVWSMALPAWR